jgi:S1-C subfamily serine protease
VSRIDNILLANRPKEAVGLETLLLRYSTDRSAFENTVLKARDFHKYAFKNGVDLPLRGAIFTRDQLTAVILALEENGSVESKRLDAAIFNCLELGLISQVSLPESPTAFLLQAGIIGMYVQPNVLDNIVCGFYYHLSKYQRSIVPIVVKKTNGDEGIGTGFYYTPNSPSSSGWIITNKHVALEDVAQIESLGSFIQVADNSIIEHPVLDLCAIRVRTLKPLPGLFFERELILDEVVAIGFPNVAQSIRPAMLCHRGEVNGRIAGYLEKGEELLVVSCHVAPGNSGGPLLNKAGMVLGVVCQSKIGRSMAEIEGVSSVHHVAIPGDTMKQFVSQLS